MAMTLEQLKQHAIDFISHTWKSDPEEEVTPMFIAANEEGVSVYSTPWRNEDDKVIITEMLRREFRQKGIVAYVTVSEAWRKSYHRDVDLNTAPRPAQCEDREEVLIFGGQDINDNRFHFSMPINRAEDGQRSLGEKEPEAEADTLRGRMVSLLSDRSDG